jgi:hypothetical protein
MKCRQHTRADIPRARVLYVDLTRRLMIPQKYRWEHRDRVLLVVDMHHISAQHLVNKVREILVADTGHTIANHFHGHARGEVQAEEDAVKKRERSAEGVTDDSDR